MSANEGQSPNYDTVYDQWDDLPNCRITIPGEGLWGKELPDGTYGINNMPLSETWQWQDIVRSKNLNDTDPEQLVHRRWLHKLWFSYDEPEGEEEALEVRGKILEALKPLGSSGFFCKGQAYLLIQEEISPDECRSNIVKALDAVGISLPEPTDT